MATDWISPSELAQELGCTRQNVNARIRSWGVRRDKKGRISRAAYVEAQQRLGSPTQTENRHKAPDMAARRPVLVSKPSVEHREIRREPAAQHRTPEPKDSRAEAERIRALAHAQMLLLDLEARKRTLIKRDEAVAAWSSMISSARASLLQLGAELAPRLRDGMTIMEREHLINSEVRKALTALSEYNPE